MNHAVFIISHERADTLTTWQCLKRSGYTGPIYIVIDNRDSQQDKYKANYGDAVLVFDKDDYAWVDVGDNQSSLNSPVVPKAAVFDFAKKLGVENIVICDDDIEDFRLRCYDDAGHLKSYKTQSYRVMDSLFDACFEFMSCSKTNIVLSFLPIAKMFPDTMKKIIRQGTNVFLFKTDYGFRFRGRFYDDGILSHEQNDTGSIVMTIQEVNLVSKIFEVTKNTGGLNEAYSKTSGYARRFYHLMASPSDAPMNVTEFNGRLSFFLSQKDYVRIIPEECRK